MNVPLFADTQDKINIKGKVLEYLINKNKPNTTEDPKMKLHKRSQDD